MGPLSKNGWGMHFATRHSKCRNRENCNGPGCAVVSGKTAKRNAGRMIRAKNANRQRRESE